MRFSCLALERMLFLLQLDVRTSEEGFQGGRRDEETYPKVGMIVSGLSAGRVVLIDKLLLLEDGLAVHLFKQLEAKFDVSDERITSGLREVLANNHPEHLEVIRPRRHGVSWHDPTAHAELMCQCKLIIVAICEFGKTESHERKTFS